MVRQNSGLQRINPTGAEDEMHPANTANRFFARELAGAINAKRIGCVVFQPGLFFEPLKT